MLSPAMQDALNRQMAAEFASSYLYLAMSAYCAARNFDGFAHWLRLQSQEETDHALKFFDMVIDRGGQVTLQPLGAPRAEYESLLDVMQQALAHEQQVTAMIEELYAVAVREEDYTAQAQLQWFLTEQVEEEKITSHVVEMLKLAGDSRHALLMLDKELGEREEEEE